MSLPRWMHKLWAFVNGYFWLPCPACGRFFGGHEAKDSIPVAPGMGLMTCCKQDGGKETK